LRHTPPLLNRLLQKLPQKLKSYYKEMADKFFWIFNSFFRPLDF